MVVSFFIFDGAKGSILIEETVRKVRGESSGSSNAERSNRKYSAEQRNRNQGKSMLHANILLGKATRCFDYRHSKDCNVRYDPGIKKSLMSIG